MQIMSLNGWGGKEYKTLLPYLDNAQPDVLCLQEVIHTPTAPIDWMEYRDPARILPQRARFFDDVCRVLPNHIATFCPAAQGLLWDGDEPYPSQWGLATFVRSDLTLIGQSQGFVYKDFGPDGYGDHPRSRTGHTIRLWDFDRGGAVTIAHMHGLWVEQGKADIPERTEQAHAFANMIRQVANTGDAIVACGDFNVLPGSDTFEILGSLGLCDLVTGRGYSSTRSNLYEKPGKFADYLMVSEDLIRADFKIVRDPVVSDHCPLVLTI